jgi:hypothetical protein
MEAETKRTLIFMTANLAWVSAMTYCRVRMAKAEKGTGAKVSAAVNFITYKPVSIEGIRFRCYAIMILVVGGALFLCCGAPLLSHIH